MKPTSYPKPRRKHFIIIAALLFTLHVTLGLCKPASDADATDSHNLLNPSPPPAAMLLLLPNNEDLKNASSKEAAKSRERDSSKAIDLRGVSLNRYGDDDDTDLSGGRDPPRNNADPDSAGGQYVAARDAMVAALEEEDMHQATSEVDRSRKLWRHSSHTHRKRRRRHKVAPRTRAAAPRNNNHKHHRRDRFLLKSDGPGHVIFSADEVKRDWCRTIPFNQTVTAGRCRSKVVRNNLCYGQCNSFFIPQSERTGNKVAFQSCSFCKPHRLKWVNVTLGCPGRNPPKVQKTILKIESCRCIAAEREEVDRNLQYLQKGARHTVQ